ncbi:PH domain-containing protein [Kitasatospora sp. NPDC088134]|uniref:PH domain-containing protein n=1 Tax=Kitasatospora sp. NPDC088134 TaxID=3364071 RepID=UPI003802BC16
MALLKTYKNPSYSLLGLTAVAVGFLLACLDLSAARSLTFETVAKILLYVALAAFGVAVVRIKVRSTPEGVEVKNLLSSRFAPWREITGFRTEASLVIDLADGRAIKCSAVQPSNVSHVSKGRSYAHRVADELNAALSRNNGIR